MKINLNINLEDISQITIGSFAFAVPISFSEEAWRLGETLPFFNLLVLFILSVCFLSFYAYGSIFQANIKKRYFVFGFRIIFAYFIALCVVALILISISKFPIITEPLIALKRLIVIGMPASMGAIIVDGLDKE